MIIKQRKAYSFSIHACWKYTRETDWYHPSSQTTGIKTCKPSSTEKKKKKIICFKNAPRKFQKKIITDVFS